MTDTTDSSIEDYAVDVDALDEAEIAAPDDAELDTQDPEVAL